MHGLSVWCTITDYLLWARVLFEPRELCFDFKFLIVIESITEGNGDKKLGFNFGVVSLFGK